MVAEGIADLIERHADLQRDYEGLLENLKWVHAVASILVELEGGVVEISRETLENYDLRGQVRVSKDEERDMYVIETIAYEGDEIS